MSAVELVGGDQVIDRLTGQAYDVTRPEDAAALRLLVMEYRSALQAISQRCDETLRGELARQATDVIRTGDYEAREGTGRVHWIDAPGLRDDLAAAGVSAERLAELFTLKVRQKADGLDGSGELGKLERRNEAYAEIIAAHRKRDRGSIYVKRRASAPPPLAEIEEG